MYEGFWWENSDYIQRRYSCRIKIYKDKLENRSKESITAKSWWHRLIRQLRFICKER